MSSSFDQSNGSFGGLFVGFISFSVFGIASWLLFGLVSVKSPTDRTSEGDFSAKTEAQRVETLQLVREGQNKLVNASKLTEAFANFKSTSPAATSIPFPGSETALKAAQQSAPPEKTEPEAPAPSAVPGVNPDAKKPEPAPEENPEAAKSPPAAPQAATPGPGKNPKAKSKPKGKDAEPAVE